MKYAYGFIGLFIYICNMERIKTRCICGNIIETTQTRIDAGRGKFCSKKCMYANRTRRSGIKYNFVKENTGRFKKGDKPWCTGTKGVLKAWNKGKKGVMKPNETSYKKGENTGQDNVNWKGGKVSYMNLHGWIYRHLGKACKCSKCESEVNVEWANKSHEYKRDLTDWMQLCSKCHKKHDKGLSSIKANFDTKLRRL